MQAHEKGIRYTEGELNGAGCCIGIVRTRWNADVVDALMRGCVEALHRVGVRSDDIVVATVPGAFELPFAAKSLADSGRVDAVVCIGCLIKGATMHFEHIAAAVSQGIARVGLDTGTPVLFGVLTCLTDEQALERAGLCGGARNHGEDWGLGAVEMARLRQRWPHRDLAGRGVGPGAA